MKILGSAMSRKLAASLLLAVAVIGCSTGAPSAPRPTASPTQTASPAAKSYVGGTITWDAVTTSGAGADPTIVTVSGRADLVLLAEKSYGFTAERGGGSTYSYDYTLSHCTPTAHPKGTLETSTQGAPEGSTIADALIQGSPGHDLSIALLFNDQWEATCYGSTSLEGMFEQFPGCGPPDGWVPATFDGLGIYVIECETSTNLPDLKRTGHISGTLHQIAGPGSGG